MMLDSKSPSVVQLLAKLESTRVEIATVTTDDSIDLGSAVKTRVLSPEKVGEYANDNSASLVLAVECYGRTVLLPGDLEKEGMERLLRRPPTKCDLLMAAHHGSPNSDPVRFLKWAAPEFVAVSCGDKKFSPLAKELFAQSGCVVKRTDAGGAIRFVVEQDGRVEFRSYLDRE